MQTNRELRPLACLPREAHGVRRLAGAFLGGKAIECGNEDLFWKDVPPHESGSKVSRTLQALREIGKPGRCLAKELWGELVQVVAPVNPSMSSRRFNKDRLEPVLLEHLDRSACRGDKEIVLAGAEPKEL